MAIAGVICEYNPFHTGHEKQFRQIRNALGQDTAIVCLMSGNFVQRGAPAIFDKSLRAEAALRCGADLVLELPLPCSLSSAEGFAAGGVSILGRLCDYLAFGCETGDSASLMDTAQALLSPGFSKHLKDALSRGISFPAARQAALEAMGARSALAEQPNDILALEYCKAVLTQSLAMKIFPLRREGRYHDETPDAENPSARGIRGNILRGKPWEPFLPDAARPCFHSAPIHTLDAGERAILARLRTMSDQDFSALPYGSEGLWRRLMHACREEASLEEILSAVKTKRYTRTRLDRMILCAFLGLTAADMEAQVPYCRILGFRERGRQILKKAGDDFPLVNAGAAVPGPYWEREQQWENLYGLFRQDFPDRPGKEKARRVVYLPD